MFAATVEHASGILSLLKAEQAALVSAETSATERDRLINALRAQRLRYLVNVSALITVLMPHVDVIAILRSPKFISLYQQNVGSCLRLYLGKTACLILNYAGNSHDLYSPEVGHIKPTAGSQLVQVF